MTSGAGSSETHDAAEAQHPPPGSRLAVSTTPFWRLPAPDGRRINQVVTNDTSYAFGGAPIGADGGGRVFLVDQSGTIVWVGVGSAAYVQMDPLARGGLANMVDALLRRRGGGNGPAPAVAPVPKPRSTR